MRRKTPMILIRWFVGLVFLTEGILKFVRPTNWARGGLPGSDCIPHLLAPLVGAIEIAGGAAVASASSPAMPRCCCWRSSYALITTKLPILLGRPVGPFALMKAPHYGWLGFLHEHGLTSA